MEEPKIWLLSASLWNANNTQVNVIVMLLLRVLLLACSLQICFIQKFYVLPTEEGLSPIRLVLYFSRHLKLILKQFYLHYSLLPHVPLLITLLHLFYSELDISSRPPNFSHYIDIIQALSFNTMHS